MRKTTDLISMKNVHCIAICRIKFGRNIFKDLTKLEASFPGEWSGLFTSRIRYSVFVSSIGDGNDFHADPTIPKTIDEWLEQFEMFSTYEILPEILEPWDTNLITDVEAKKSRADLSGK